MAVDGAYALTRRRGKQATVSRLTSTSANSESGAQTNVYTTTTVRWVAKQPTQYHRLIRAEAVQQRVGETTFFFWLKDVEAVFTTLRQEDYITYEGHRYEVVSAVVEDTALVVTGRETAS